MFIDVKIAIIVVWTVSIIGCLIMNGICPECFKPYAVYVVLICTLFTVFLNIFVWLVQDFQPQPTNHH